jgi:plasmid segregation protein ParM
MNMKILGIDAGNYSTKVCNGEKVFSFPSDIGEYRERRLEESFSNDDIIWEYNGEKGFAGTLAKYESEYGGTVKGKTKANNEAVLRILIALFKYGENNNKIIVGQPIDYHLEKEKNKLKDLLKGCHQLIINGEQKDIMIDAVEVAPEGPSAMLSNPKNGLIRVIDIGSGTTNFATLVDLKRIDKGSFTEQIGTEIMRNKDPKEMAKGIYKIVSGTWGINDDIYLTGGGADQIQQHLKEFLPNSQILKPKLGNSLINTKYANSIGFYQIAKGLFGSDN